MSRGGDPGKDGARASIIPGLGASLIAVAVASVFHALLPGLPLLTAAVVLGILVGQLTGFRMLLDGVLAAGIRFSAKTLMRAGIVLLGLKLSLIDIADLGIVVIGGIVLLVAATFFGTWWFGRAMRLPGDEPLLIAAGFSICGASAIGAMAGITRTPARDQATPVALVTLCGTLAIAVLPALQRPLGLSDAQFGQWVGAGVHDVGQVVATAQTAGATALAVAVVVKLTRVLMLAPMVGIASAVARRGSSADPSQKRPPVIPLFVAGFLAAVLLNTLVDLPPLATSLADTVQTLLLAAALFALGTGVQVAKLVRTGWRALVVGLASWAFIAALAYLLVRVTASS